MAYDAESDRVILFLGAMSETGDYFDLAPWSETWVYDFDTDTWTNMEPVETPYGLRGPRMVYDAESDRMILFGGWEVGNSTKGGAFEEVWAYDYNTNTWTKMDPKVSPPGRNYHAMAYDAESDRVILWGGDGPVPVDVRSVWAYDYNADLWEELESRSFDYNSNTWAQLSDSPMPGDLLYHAMVYIGKSDRIIIYGGGPNLDFHKDNIWVYDLNTSTWTDVTRR
jgi:N-acetylneuraminic acid mutarotase